MEDQRLLLIDASLNHRLAYALRKRGRNVLSLRQIRFSTKKDPPLLRLIHLYCQGAVLVTADDHLPSDHAVHCERWKITVAVVDPVVVKPYDAATDIEAWKWEVVQRWAHLMQNQAPGTIYRYNDRGRQKWTKPRKLRRFPKAAKAPTSLPTAIPTRSPRSETGGVDHGVQGALNMNDDEETPND